MPSGQQGLGPIDNARNNLNEINNTLVTLCQVLGVPSQPTSNAVATEVVTVQDKLIELQCSSEAIRIRLNEVCDFITKF